MPELPLTVNTVVTRIDAPFPEQWREGLYEFTKEIAAIRESLDALSVSQTASAQASDNLAKLYTEQAVAERASRAVAEEQHQARPTNEEGTPVGASRPEVFRSPEPPPGSPGREREERENPSRPPDEEPNILDKEITMPQHYGGKYTTQDLLILAGKAARWKGSEGAAETFGRLAEIQPNVSAGANLIRTYANAGRSASEGLQSYAGSLGYQPGNGISLGPLGSTNSLNIGPFSFRTPFSSGAASGLGSMIDAYTEAMTVPGLSGQQAMSMQQSLAERGWFPDQAQTQELFDAQTKLFGKGGVFQQLAENPEVMEMMDKATRSGTTSTTEMVKAIEEIPKAAEAAHEGVQQMVADMKAYGEFSESQGGTNYAGYKQALDMATSTGMPAAASMGLINSPWTSSMLFRSTGLPEWMQGTLPGGLKNEAATKAFFQAARTVGRPESYTVTNFNGAQETVSGIKQQAAMMHKFMFPEMSIEQIEKRLRMGPQGMLGREKINRSLRQWKEDADTMLKRGVNTEKVSAWISGGEEGQMPGGFGHLLSKMLDLKTADGRPMFSHEDIKKIRSNFGEGYDSKNEDLVAEKYAAVQKILREKAEKQSNNTGSPSHTVMIELSSAARKFLQLPNRKTRMKAETNAGGPEPINHSAVGATDYLTPQPGTHPVPDNAGGFVYVPNE